MSQYNNVRIQSRVDTESNWMENNPKLLKNEIGYLDSGKYKIGNGVDRWNDLPYAKTDDSEMVQVGKATIEGGEIFNDYENNKSLSTGSSSSGKNTLSGIKGYYILSFDFSTPENPAILLSNVKDQEPTEDLKLSENFELGDWISIENGPHYEDCAQVAEIHENYILTTALPFSEYEHSTLIDDNILFNTAKPENGLVLLGNNAHAEGEYSQATERAAHAEGYGSHAKGRYSHAEGLVTSAVYAAHAEGNETKAKGHYSHTEGLQTLTLQQAAHAEGYQTTAEGLGSHSEGRKSTATGEASHAEGSATKAIGDFTHSQGQSAQAWGIGSHAEGYGAKAYGAFSHAEGNLCSAGDFSTKDPSIAMYSHVEGISSKTIGEGSHAEGYSCDASGKYSHAEGNDCTVNVDGIGGHAEGEKTAVKAAGGHAEGYKGSVTGAYGHAEGYSCSAIGAYGHAEGESSKAQGQAGHAEGYSTEAYGKYSHSEGNDTKASGQAAHAEGQGTLAKGANQHVQGKFNISDSTSAHIVGNGKDAENLSNAHTLDWNGNAWYAGTVEATAIILKSTESDKRFKITVDDNGVLTITAL